MMKIRIQVNNSCNAACRYCQRYYSADYKYREGFCGEYGSISSDKLFVFMAEAFREHPDFKVQFVGGEPLVNWENMKPLIRGMCSLPEYDSSRAELMFGTNGLLLNDEVADFCNRYNVRVMLGVDGFNSDKVKGIHLSGKSLEAFGQVRNDLGYIDSVIYPGNPSIVKSDIALKRRFPGRKICHGIIFAKRSISENMWRFSDAVVERAVVELKAYVNHGKADGLYDRFVRSVFRTDICLDDVSDMNIIRDGIYDRNGEKLGDITMSFREVAEASNRKCRKKIERVCGGCPNIGFCKDGYKAALECREGEKPFCSFQQQWCRYVRKYFDGDR